MNYKGEPIELVESSEVKEGVVCEVYKFNETSEKDLGKVFVQAGHKTPLQKVLQGDKTIERFESGAGILSITSLRGKVKEYVFPGELEEVEVLVGEHMQWYAEEDLIFYEICWPPYQDGRFEDVIEE
jgi:hypothetical protein